MRESVKLAFDRLQYGNDVEEDIQELVGTRYHVPIFDTDAFQELLQRPNAEELLLEYYADPSPADTPLTSDSVVYTITEANIEEADGLSYRVKRALDRTKFDAKVTFHMELEDSKIPNPGLTGHSLYDDIDGWIRSFVQQDHFEVGHEFRSMEHLHWNLYLINVQLFRTWAKPQTFSELFDYAAQWENFNQFREKFR